MDRTEEQSALAHEIDQVVLVDSHEHLAPPPTSVKTQEDLGEWLRRESSSAERGWVEGGPDILRDLFGNYVAADLLVAGASQQAVDCLLDSSGADIEQRFAAVKPAWELTQHTGYGEAVRVLAKEIYGLEELTGEGLRQAQSRLEQLQRPGEMLRLLSETARLDHVQIDDFRWPCVADPGGPEFFLYDLSWRGFSNGEIEPERILEVTGVEVRTLEDLNEAMAAIFKRYAACAIAVKAQHAYQRTLRWEERSDEDAARALAAALKGDGIDEPTRLVLGDWCWARGVELAIEHNLPFKLHTGYYAGTGGMPVDRIKAGNLCALLARYPEARFVLMHIAYPYNDELIALAKHYPNVWVDLCWAWSIDPYSSADFVRRFLHAVPINKLFAFGGDTHTPTAAVAYSIQARRWLARALEAEVAGGDLTETQAITVAHRLMRDNQYECFDLEGTQAAARDELERAASVTSQ